MVELWYVTIVTICFLPYRALRKKMLPDFFCLPNMTFHIDAQVGIHPSAHSRTAIMLGYSSSIAFIYTLCRAALVMFEYLSCWALVISTRSIFCYWLLVSGSSSFSASILRKSRGINVYRHVFLRMCFWMFDLLEQSSDSQWSAIAISFWHVWEVRNAVRKCGDALMLHPLCTMVQHVLSHPSSAPRCRKSL